MTPKEQKQVENIMRLLECSEEEAIDIVESDKIIDKGGRTSFDLPEEKEKEIKKLYAVKERMAKSADNKRGKVRAENLTKSGVIAKLFDFLNENEEISFENVTILNKERQIAFKIGEDNYELTLVQKRKPKK